MCNYPHIYKGWTPKVENHLYACEMKYYTNGNDYGVQVYNLERIGMGTMHNLVYNGVAQENNLGDLVCLLEASFIVDKFDLLYKKDAHVTSRKT